jgi:hypothetical protein
MDVRARHGQVALTGDADLSEVAAAREVVDRLGGAAAVGEGDGGQDLGFRWRRRPSSIDRPTAGMPRKRRCRMTQCTGSLSSAATSPSNAVPSRAIIAAVHRTLGRRGEEGGMPRRRRSTATVCRWIPNRRASVSSGTLPSRRAGRGGHRYASRPSGHARAWLALANLPACCVRTAQSPRPA